MPKSTLQKISFLIVLIFTFIACDKNDNNNEETIPEPDPTPLTFTIIEPAIDLYQPTGVTVPIEISVKGISKLESAAVLVSNTTTNDTVLISFDQINSLEYLIDTSFIANAPQGTCTNFYINISAKDINGIVADTTKAVHVMD